MVAYVLVEISHKSVDKEFCYNVPSYMCDSIKIGVRVEVPFGKMTLEGFVLDLRDSYDGSYELKSLISIKDKDIVLNDELLQLGKIMQEKTLSTLISCYQVMLPKALKAKEGVNLNIRYDSYYSLDCSIDIDNFKGKQKDILNLIINEGKVIRKRLSDISLSSLNTLIKKGILKEEKIEHYRLSYNKSTYEKKVLTSEQNDVVREVLDNDKKEVYLLHGVTGSGKTEVYMELIEDSLNKGLTSILLVPEISLTPQMVERFQKRFGDSIAALHSGLSDAEKYDEWRRIARGEASIVIGARSAIFAPLKNIGIIIVDEEHSDSYKQSDSNPRYNAKDIAIMRARYHNCSVVLGSATPTLETMARAKKNVYHYLSLPNRVNGKKLPIVRVIDMNKEIRCSRGHFSNTLLDSIKCKIDNGEQVILFLNRRGYSPIITCKSCGYTYKCPNCDISLTYHKSSNIMRCHYCGYATNLTGICPNCNEKGLNELGIGTEKIEEELNKYLDGARILRMDYDTTSRKGMHAKMISAFQNHEYDILLGTQIVTKGLDFPNVTLVGVINADTSLNIPDFRSSENTFQLLSQVAGRSGRSEKSGEVIIQTYNPDHYAIKYVQNHDYLGFYNYEMNIRRQLKYPPYYYICYIKISGSDENYINLEANKIKNSLIRNLSNMIILGPSPCTIYRMNNIFRLGIIIKYKCDDGLNEILSKIINHYTGNIKIRIDVDFNPSQIY